MSLRVGMLCYVSARGDLGRLGFGGRIVTIVRRAQGEWQFTPRLFSSVTPWLWTEIGDEPFLIPINDPSPIAPFVQEREKVPA